MNRMSVHGIENKDIPRFLKGGYFGWMIVCFLPMLFCGLSDDFILTFKGSTITLAIAAICSMIISYGLFKGHAAPMLGVLMISESTGKLTIRKNKWFYILTTASLFISAYSLKDLSESIQWTIRIISIILSIIAISSVKIKFEAFEIQEEQKE